MLACFREHDAIRQGRKTAVGRVLLISSAGMTTVCCCCCFHHFFFFLKHALRRPKGGASRHSFLCRWPRISDAQIESVRLWSVDAPRSLARSGRSYRVRQQLDSLRTPRIGFPPTDVAHNYYRTDVQQSSIVQLALDAGGLLSPPAPHLPLIFGQAWRAIGTVA